MTANAINEDMEDITSTCLQTRTIKMTDSTADLILPKVVLLPKACSLYVFTLCAKIWWRELFAMKKGRMIEAWCSPPRRGAGLSVMGVIFSD